MNKNIGSHTTESYSYNNAGLPVSKISTVNNTVINSAQIEYYPNGNQKRISQLGKPAVSYTYDDGGMLLTETVEGESVTAYAYDDRGNRISETNTNLTDNSVSSTAYTYDLNNRMTSETNVSYTYNNAGRLTGAVRNGASETYSYDIFGRITSGTKNNASFEYTYDANGLRTSKTVGGATTYYVYDGENIIADISGNTDTGYLRDNNGLVSQTKGNTKEYFVSNYRGDTTAVVNSNADILKSYDYDAFGNVKNAVTADNNPFRYCGEYFDDETGFIYLRNRYYDPSIGRFTTEDPAKSGLNWYAYCENNPVKYVDPWGLFRIIDNQAYDNYRFGAGNSKNQIVDYISEDIKKMQIKLQELGYLDSSIKSYGYFGSMTLEAVNAYKNDNQIQNNTKETEGIVGPTTWALLGLDFDVIESIGATSSNVIMSKGVLRVDRNIANANVTNTYYAATAIKNAYKLVFGEEFNVTTDSVYWELIGHIFADEVAESNRGGWLDPLWQKVQKSTAVIDIGDDVIVPDNNRWLWDWLSKR